MNKFMYYRDGHFFGLGAPDYRASVNVHSSTGLQAVEPTISDNQSKIMCN